MRSGSIVVRLTEDDVRLAYRVGNARYVGQRTAARADGAFRKRAHRIANDVEGALAEIAFWALCGREPPLAEMVLKMPEWTAKRGPLCDVLGVEVRATCHRTGRLAVHTETERDKHKTFDTPFVLGIVNRWPWYPSMTFRTGDPKLDAELGTHDPALQLYDPEVHFVGWCLRSDTRPEHWFEQMAVPEYMVPQADLRPMGTLPPGPGGTARFEMPRGEGELTDAEILDLVS